MFGLFKLFLFISVFINSPALKAKSFAGFVAVDKNSDTAAKEIEFNNDLQVIDFLKKANVLEEQKTAGLVFSKPGFYSTEKNQFVISTDLQLNIIKKSNGHLIWANLKSNPQFFLSSLKIELYSCAFKKIKDFFLDERGLAIIESKYLNSSCANGKQVAYLFSNYENNYSFLPIDVRFNFEVWKNYLPQKSTDNRLFKILYLPSVLYPGAPLSFNLLDMIGSVKTVWIKNNVRQLSYKINKIKNPRSLFFKFLLPEKIPEGEYSVVIETTSGQFFNSDEKFLILTKNSNFYSLNIDSSFPKIFSVGSFKGFSLRVNMPKGSAPKEALILKTTFSLKDSSDYLASKVLGFDFQTPKNNSDGIKINDICAARVGNLALFKTEAEVHPEISHLVEIPEIQLCKSLQNFNITFELFSNGELVYKEQKSALVSEKNFIPFIKIEKKDSLLEANYFEYDLLTKKVSPKQRDLYLRGLTSNASLDQSFEHSIVPRFSPRLESPDHLCEKNEFGLSCKIDSHFEKYYFFTDRLVDNFYSNYAEASVNVSSQAFPTNVNLTGNLDFRLSKSIYGKNETLKLSFPTALRNSRVIVFASQKKLTLYVNSKNLSPDNNFIEVPLKNFKSGAVSVSAVMHSSVSTNAKLFKSFTQYGEKSFTISDLQPSNLLVLNKSDIDSAKFTFQTGVEFGEKIETLSLLNEDVARSINSAKIWPYDDLFLNDPESVFFTTENFFLHDRMKFSRPPQQLYEPIYNIAQQKNAEALLDVKNLSFSSTGDSFISISKKDFCGFRSDLSKSALVMTTRKYRESRRYFLSLSAMQEGTEKYISSICLNHLDLLQKSSKTVSSLEAFRSDSFKSHNADWVKYSVAQENPPNNASNYYLELRSNFKPSDLAILDKSNYLVGLFRKDYSKRQLHWVEAEELPQSLVHLLLKSEDADFYEHKGVNWKSLTASALQYLEKQESSARGGASTLSMQLVRLLSQKPRSYYRTFKGKIEQIREAKNLESRLTKNEILSVYINLASFRGELVGLRAAALFTFNKNVSDLNENESAYLVSLLPSPNAELNVISKRMCRLLERSRCDDLLELATAASKNYFLSSKNLSFIGSIESLPHTKKDNSLLQSSIDLKTQNILQSAVDGHINTFKPKGLHNAAAIVIDNLTKKVIAHVQNVRTENGKNIFIDASVLNRQPGSALKPFFYGLALEKKLITFNDFVLDAPLFINLSNNRIYAPQNYSRSYSGLVSAEEALGLSLNTPAVRVSQLLNEKDIKAVLINSGIESFKNLSEVGPSFVLGTPPVSLMELTKAYSNLFSGQVFSKTTTEELFRVLSNENLRGFNLSGNPLLSFPKALAIKTGTSNNDRDSWTFASNKKLTVGIWTGNADGTVPENIGPNNSALILRSIYVNSGILH